MLSSLFSTSFLTAQITVDPNFPINPIAKAGWKLIFDDEFNGVELDHLKWDISTSKPIDDRDCNTGDSKNSYDFMLGQVSVSTGNCVLKTNKANALNSNCPSVSNCEKGVSGEIKTVTYRDPTCQAPDFPGICFINYEFPVNSYIEIRAKTPNTDCNAGAAFWLYGGNQEIDVFETTGDEDDFTSGYYSERIIDGDTYGPYQRYRNWWQRLFGNGGNIKVDHAAFTLNKEISVTTTSHFWNPNNSFSLDSVVVVQNEIIDTDPSSMFVTYGIEFTEEYIKFYLNNQLFHQFNLDDFCDGNLLQMRPKTIRLTTGKLTGGGGQNCSVPCPAEMDIDYVRAYLPNAMPAITFDKKSAICQGATEPVYATYMPGLIYSWTSSGFDFSPQWLGAPGAFMNITSKQNILPGMHTIFLTITYPDGHTESNTRLMNIFNANGVEPPENIDIECFSKYCEAIIQESRSGCNCSEANIYEWSLDGGISWKNYGTYYGFPNETGEICVRTRNCHGISLPLCKSIPYLDNDPNQHPHAQRKGNFEEGKESKITIIPNPVKEQLRVEGLKSNESVVVTIFNTLGLIVCNKTLENGFIEVSELTSGIYFLQIAQPSVDNQFIKFIKTK